MLERFNIVKDNLKELILHLNKISEIEYNTINIVIENIISNNIKLILFTYKNRRG